MLMSAHSVAPSRAPLREAVRLLPTGFIIALMSLSYAASYGMLIFGGGGGELLATGLPLILLTTCIMLAVVPLTSSLSFMIAGTDANASGVLALMVGALGADLHAAGSTPAQTAATVLVAVALSTMLAGLVMTALGTARRGSLVQFIPYPVVGGFLAGTGYLLLSGAAGIATGRPVGVGTPAALLHLHWLVWAPALLVGGVMLGAKRLRWTHPMALPATLVAACVLFFGGMRLCGISLQQARELGWLFAPLTLKGLQLPLLLPFQSQQELVQWRIIGAHYSEFFALVTVSTLTILLNATGVGMATRSEVDFNHELRSVGMTNLVGGALGGVVGYHSLSRTLMAYQSGSRNHVASLMAALLCAVCAYYFSSVIVLLPKPVLAGLLIGLGGSLLIQWAITSRRYLATIDHLLILLILAVIACTGFVTGVALGTMLACILFVVDYGRVSCVRMEFTGASLTSRVERAIEAGAALKQQGEATVGVCLQGYLFFGSSNQMVQRIRELLKTCRRYVVVDLHRVQGVDASTSQSFVKLMQICEQAGATLVMTGIPDSARAAIARAGKVREFASLDAGLEWIENAVLAALQPAAELGDWRAGLTDCFGATALQRLLDRMQTQQLDANELLFRKGDSGDCMVFIESGQVSISLALDGGEKVRLRSFGSGTIVGEMALYTGQNRTADVVTDSPARVHKLSLALLRALERDDPAVALQLHNYVVKVLANRLAVTNEAYRLSY